MEHWFKKCALLAAMLRFHSCSFLGTPKQREGRGSSIKVEGKETYKKQANRY